MFVYDFFDLAGISLTETKAARVESTLKRRIEDLNSKLTSESQDSIRHELEAQIKFLNDTKAKILRNGKLTPEFFSMVKEKTEELKRRLEARILLEKDSRKGRELVITNGKIRKIKNTSGISLTLKDIEQAYKDNGFKIETLSPLDDLPKIPDRCGDIHRELDFFRERVRKARELNSSYEEAEHVKDLYTFAAYVCGDSHNAESYAHFSAKKLREKLEPYMKKYSAYNSETVEKLEANISGQAVSFIFSSDENKKGYDQYLLLQTPELSELFARMSGLIEADLKDSDIAELCIRKIQEVFGDRRTAVAIYNKNANLINDPYIPDKAVFAVRCAHCQTVCEFLSLTEAHKLNKCTNCGEKLYKTCPSCKKFVLFSLYKCPECGYSFPDKEKFNKHIVMTEEALRRKDFTSARDNLSEARIADTTEDAKTKALEERIAREEREHNRPIDNLNAMIDALKFEEAEKYSQSILLSRPELDISLQVRRIKSVLKDCRTIFESSNGGVSRINSCLDIIDKCIDFSPALDFLASNPPAPCQSVSIHSDDEASAFLLSWKSSGERRIKYTLLRKKGSKPPANEKDGDIILMDSDELSYRDSKIEPGLIYSYSVFAHRKNRYSVPSSASGAVLAKVSDFQCLQKGKTLYLSWKTPANCSKVNVSFQNEGSEKIIASGSQSSAVIEDAKFGTKYIFILSANYPGLGQSRKNITEFTPSAEIKDFRISSRHVKDNIYEISWDIKESGIDMQILSGQEVLSRTRSEMRTCQIRLKENKYYVIKGAALSGGKLQPSTNEIRINTYSPCVIDEKETKITEDSKNINISVALSGNMPENLKYFAYFVSYSSESPREDEALSPDSGRKIITAESWRHDKRINIAVPSEGITKFFVTIFAVYNDGGNERISAPCKKIFTLPLSAKVFWEIRRPFWGNKHLLVRFSANRPLSHRPGFVLCSSSNGRQVLTPSDINAVKILEKSEEILSSEQSEISCDFEIEQKLSGGQDLFLFIVNTKPDEAFDIPRWEAGFNGKS